MINEDIEIVVARKEKVLKDLAKYRNELADELHISIGQILKDFKSRTQLDVCSIDIHISEHHNIGHVKPQYRYDNTRVVLAAEKIL